MTTRSEASRERRMARAAAATRRTYKATAVRTPRVISGVGNSSAGRRSGSGVRRGSRGKTRYERAGLASRISVVLPEMPRIRLDWRTASLAIVIMFGALLFYVLSTPTFFVNSINLAGASHVSAEEIYDASGLTRVHIFWVRPETVQANIEQVPGIASAKVDLAWPNQVTVTVVEREPVLVWEQNGESVWVDRSGTMFPARGEIADLLPVLVDDVPAPVAAPQAEATAEAPEASADEGQDAPETVVVTGAEPAAGDEASLTEVKAPADIASVPVEAIVGALQLRELRPNIEQLHYDAKNGLSYQDGRGWRGYFGVGDDMEVKLRVYETVVANLMSRGIQPVLVSVANPDAPYYKHNESESLSSDEE